MFIVIELINAQFIVNAHGISLQLDNVEALADEEEGETMYPIERHACYPSHLKFDLYLEHYVYICDDDNAQCSDPVLDRECCDDSSWECYTFGKK